MVSYTPVDYDPFTEAPSAARADQSFLQGMKLGAKKRALGVIELGANLAGSLGADVSGLKELTADVGQQYAREGTGTGFKGGVAEFIGDPLTYIPAATLGKVLLSGAAMGATAPTGKQDSNLVDNLLGGLQGTAASGLGYGAGKALTKIARPVSNQLNSVGRAAIQKLEQARVPLSAAQKTGSKALESLEAVFSTLPTTSAAQKAFRESQADAFTGAALKEAGIRGVSADRTAIANAAKKFGEEYTELASKNVMKIDEPLLVGVASAYDQASNGVLGLDASSLVKKVARDVFDAKGAIDGTVYQKTRSMLTQASQSAKPHEAGVLKALRNELDAAFERSLPESQRGIMADINRRYQSFKPIQKAMETSKAEILRSGKIDPTALYQQVPVGAPLSDLADAGAAFLRPTVPDSGTAQRLFMQNALTGAGLAGAGYGATSDSSLAPYAGYAGLALAGPRIAQKIYQSGAGQKYLTQGMPAVIQKAVAGAPKRLAKSIASGVALNSANPKTAAEPAPENYTPVDYDPFAGADAGGGFLDKLSLIESGNNPNAKAKTSTASGLYQFTDGTWNRLVGKYGKQYGIGTYDKNSPEAQRIFAEILTAENSDALSGFLGRAPDETELYAAHFLGINGAKKLLKNLNSNKDAAAILPREAMANKSIFFAGKRPRKVREVYAVLNNKLKM